MQLDEVRWGIVGCGDVCEVKSGPPAMNQPGSRVVHVMRRDGDRAADFARRHGVPRWSTGIDAVLDDPEVNAVYVATPPGSHRDLALRVAAAGKACLVEKPMARTAGECRQMIEAFEERGLPLLVAYYRRCLPRWVKVKELLDAGRLGTLTSIDYRMTRLYRPDPTGEWRLDPRQAGGGLVMDLGSHLLDLLDHLAGPLRDVRGVCRSHDDSPVEDVVAMSFTAGEGGGAVGTASWNFAGSAMCDRLTLSGTAGALSISCFGNEPFTLTPHPGLSATRRRRLTCQAHVRYTGRY